MTWLLTLYVGVAIGAAGTFAILLPWCKASHGRRAALDALHAVRRHRAARRVMRNRRYARQWADLWANGPDLNDPRR